jgi:hypothetical protein
LASGCSLCRAVRCCGVSVELIPSLLMMVPCCVRPVRRMWATIGQPLALSALAIDHPQRMVRVQITPLCRTMPSTRAWTVTPVIAPTSQNGRWRPKPPTSEVHPRPRGRAASIRATEHPAGRQRVAGTAQKALPCPGGHPTGPSRPCTAAPSFVTFPKHRASCLRAERRQLLAIAARARDRPANSSHQAAGFQRIG